MPPTNIQQRAYTYSKAGDITSITDQLAGATYNYEYDTMHRLVSETGGPAVPGDNIMSYAYDDLVPVHAVKGINLNGTNYTYAYDANGNMTTGYDFTDPANVAVRTITYNADNKPVSIEMGGTVTAFVYDGAGTRAKKVVGASVTYYVGEHYEVKDGVATKYVFAGDTRVAQIKGAARYYFHKDHLGSSTVITDATGSVVAAVTTEYLPFGNERSSTGAMPSDYKYTDQELDSSTGLYDYGARHYDPEDQQGRP